jgi:hypothetical protein
MNSIAEIRAIKMTELEDKWGAKDASFFEHSSRKVTPGLNEMQGLNQMRRQKLVIAKGPVVIETRCNIVIVCFSFFIKEIFKLVPINQTKLKRIFEKNHSKIPL